MSKDNESSQSQNPKGKEKDKVKVWVSQTSPFILLTSVLNRTGIGAEISDILAEKGINIEAFMAFSAPGKERIDILIEVSEEDLPVASYLLESLAKDIQARGILYPGLYVEELASLVVQGPKLYKTPGLVAKIFKLFAKKEINVWSLFATRAGDEDIIKVWVEKKILSQAPEILEEVKGMF